MIQLYNIDCMEYMSTCSDKQFDLAIVDPPYGIGIARTGTVGGSNKKHPAKQYTPSEWDRSTPTAEYFNELVRVSVNQIIWGANHFQLRTSSAWIVWDKLTTGNFSDCELAWTSFNHSVKKFTYCWNGFQQGEKFNTIEKRIHPTQKPIDLYKWLLKNYATTDMTIIDTHLGSGSSAIAAHDFGCDFVGCEIDKDYFEAAKKRFEIYTLQQKLF